MTEQPVVVIKEQDASFAVEELKLSVYIPTDAGKIITIQLFLSQKSLQINIINILYTL